MSDLSSLSKIATLWSSYFPNDHFSSENSKVPAINAFNTFFESTGHEILQRGYDHSLSNNKSKSIYFSVKQLCAIVPFTDFLELLKNKPMEVIGCVGIAISLVIRSKLASVTDIDSSVDAYHPRFVQFTSNTLYSELKSSIVGQLVSIRGYAIKVSPCKPLIEGSMFKCAKCKNDIFVPFEDGVYNPPLMCHAEVSRNNKCKNKVLEIIRSSAFASDYQRLKLQEEDLLTEEETARLPRTFDVELRGDLINKCIPGDIVNVIGIVSTMSVESKSSYNKDSGIHQLYIIANSVTRVSKASKSSSTIDDVESIYSSDKRENNDKINYSESQLQWIRGIASANSCFGLLIASLCPTIFGHELVKAGIVLALFGGTNSSDASNNKDTAFKIRSDIHVLIVGDPGLGKSQMLRAAANIAPRAVFVCGNTATAVGLTVSIVKEKGKHGDMAIEAGALVLADKGICCIDELDKMQCDPHALLEAMEQQAVHIAKSGMVTSLRSRTTVLAAANPSDGHYNRRKTVCENLKMAAALLSRFDLVFILLDRPDANHDRLISEHIMRTHSLANSNTDDSANKNPTSLSSIFAAKDTITRDSSDGNIQSLSQRLRNEAGMYANHTLSNEIFRSYIEYAKTFCFPKLTKSAAKVLQKLYLTMRAQSSLGNSIPVTTRNLESLIRLAQARARLDLREEVTVNDANDVVQLLQESLLDAFTTETGEMEFSSRKGGISTAKSIKSLIKLMTREAAIKGSNIFSKYEISEYVNKLKLDKDVDTLIESMRTECYLLLKGPKLYGLNTV